MFLGLGKWSDVPARMSVCAEFTELGRHCLQTWPAAVSQSLQVQEPWTVLDQEEEAEGLNSRDSFSWHAGVVTFSTIDV